MVGISPRGRLAREIDPSGRHEQGARGNKRSGDRSRPAAAASVSVRCSLRDSRRKNVEVLCCVSGEKQGRSQIFDKKSTAVSAVPAAASKAKSTQLTTPSHAFGKNAFHRLQLFFDTSSWPTRSGAGGGVEAVDRVGAARDFHHMLLVQTDRRHRTVCPPNKCVTCTSTKNRGIDNIQLPKGVSRQHEQSGFSPLSRANRSKGYGCMLQTMSRGGKKRSATCMPLDL